MSYATIAVMTQDNWLMLRCRAAIAKESLSAPEGPLPALAKAYDLSMIMWVLAAQPTWDTTWEYAVNVGRPEGAPPIGNDGTVITDGMILSAVQSLT